jgi:uncharacterized membrane protein
VPPVAAESDQPAATASRGLERGRQLDRVNAFSDGLFTISATLLVLSIDVPDIPKGEVSAKLPEAIGHLFSGQIPTYFLSFWVIAVFWLRHHELFGRLARSDTRFAAINLLFLAFVSLLPFPTELLGQYGREPLVVALYAGNLVILSLLLRWLAHEAERAHLLHPGLRAVDRAAELRGRTTFVLFVISIPLAWVEPRLSMACWFGALFVHRLIARRYPG